MSKAVFAIYELFNAEPSFKDEVLGEGMKKYNEDIDYTPFRRQIENLRERSFL